MDKLNLVEELLLERKKELNKEETDKKVIENLLAMGFVEKNNIEKTNQHFTVELKCINSYNFIVRIKEAFISLEYDIKKHGGDWSFGDKGKNAIYHYYYCNNDDDVSIVNEITVALKNLIDRIDGFEKEPASEN